MWCETTRLYLSQLVSSSLVARPDAVPYGRCRNLLLETRAKERFSTGEEEFYEVDFPLTNPETHNIGT